MSFVHHFLIQTLRAVKALDDADCPLQALVVLYAAVDTVAWLGTDEEDVTAKSFTAWVDRYMLPGSPLLCTSLDIYAARCALLHTQTAESRLSRRGAARQIWYFGRGQSREYLDAEIAGRAEIVGVRVVELIEAFAQGAKRFADELGADSERGHRARERAQRWLRWIEPAVNGGQQQSEPAP